MKLYLNTLVLNYRAINIKFEINEKSNQGVLPEGKETAWKKRKFSHKLVP